MTTAIAPTLFTALNQQAAAGLLIELQSALCFELPADGNVPEWVPLIPVGAVQGRDGRQWTNEDPEAVIAHTKTAQREQPLDWEHSTELKAPKGEPAPAAGWFSDYRVNNGFIEGRLALNAEGAASVTGKQYRYISPVFRHTSDGRIWDITSAALTNIPNLVLPALNHQQHTPEGMMNLAQLLALLGLPADTTFEAALNHVKTLQGELQTAKNRAETPPLDKFVPRADYDTVLQRASNAEQKLADNAKAEKDSAINKAVDDAIAQGKVAPASKDFYVAACRQEGGLEQFASFVAGAPVIAGGTGLDGKQPAGTQTALNAEQQKMASFFGNSEEDLKQYGGM